MGTYVIGDIHGCFTQFDELRTRIEAKDPDAVFILIGDIISRGSEDEKMLEWAYNNITADGKYQMVLGNHDDAFIGTFGRDEFEDVYGLDGRKPPEEEFAHLKDTELMYKYAVFLAKQPLVKDVEVGGQKFKIVHAWYDPEKIIADSGMADTKADGHKNKGNKDKDKGEDNEDSLKEKIQRKRFSQRYCLLWERFLDEYSGEIELRYKPTHNEKLIHGHTPTIFPKDATYRGYAPGKVWDMGGNVDVDCGLVFNINKRSKYGNLAAYNLETGTAEYLYDIADDYATRDGEYLDDKLERKKRERAKEQRQKRNAYEKAKPYLLTFYKQVFNLDDLPAKDDRKYRCDFNFLGDYLSPSIDTGRKKSASNPYKFDFEKEPMLAMVDHHEGKNWKDTLYLYNVSSKRWIGVDLYDGKDDDDEYSQKIFYYTLFKYDSKYYLLTVNYYKSQYLKVLVHGFDSYKAESLLYYKTDTPRYYYEQADAIMESDIKIDKPHRRYYYYNDDDNKMEPNGLVTCDFYDDKELFTVKALRNLGDSIFVRVLDSQKNVLAEVRQKSYH